MQTPVLHNVLLQVQKKRTWLLRLEFSLLFVLDCCQQKLEDVQLNVNQEAEHKL